MANNKSPGKSTTANRLPPKVPTNGDRLNLVSGPKIEVQVEDRLFRQLKDRLFPAEVAGILRQSQTGDLYWQDQLWGIMVERWPRLQTNLKKLHQAVAGMEYEVKAYALRGEEATDSAIEKANFVEEALFGMRSNAAWQYKDFSETVQALTDSIISGFTVLEVDWEYRNGFGLAPSHSRWLPGRYWRYPYVMDAVDRLMLNPSGMLGSTQLVDFQPYKFLVSIVGSHACYPVFAAPMRCLTSWWLASTFGLEWFMTFAQLFGIPQRIAYYEPGDDTVYNQLVQMMRASASATWGVYPKGTEINLQTASNVAGAMPQERLINEADRVCDIMILGQTLTTDVRESGSRALGDVHKSVLESVQEAAARYAAKQITDQIIPGIVQANFGDLEELPRLLPVVNTPIDLMQMATAFNILFNQMKIPVSKQELYDRIQFTPPEEDEELYEPGGPSTSGKGTQGPDSGGPSENSPTGGIGAPGSEGGQITGLTDYLERLQNPDNPSPQKIEELEAANPHREQSGRFTTREKAAYRIIDRRKVHKALPEIKDRFPQEAQAASELEQYFVDNAHLIQGVSWHSIVDENTTPECRLLNGRRWTYPELTPIGHDIPFPGFPPIFYNCRSHCVPIIRHGIGQKLNMPEPELVGAEEAE